METPIRMDAFATFLGWLMRYKAQIARIGVGHLSYATFNFFFDQVLYVFMVYRLGVLLGGALMTTASLLGCAATLLVYQRMGIDWVGSGALHSLVSKEKPSLIERLLLWAIRKGKVAIFFALCLYQDPFITTAYFIKGRFGILETRDWQIFFGSVLVSNGYWTLRSGLVAQVIVYAFGKIHGGG
jgi:hypothetical protein